MAYTTVNLSLFDATISEKIVTEQCKVTTR